MSISDNPPNPAGININDVLSKAIMDAMHDQIEEAVKKAIEEAKVKLDGRVADIVSGVCLRVVRQVSMHQFGEELHIKVRLDGKL